MALARTVLGGDIGGTNARLRLMHGDPIRGGGRVLLHEATYGTNEHGSISELLQRFLDEGKAEAPNSCCLAVAGVVEDNRCKMTNAGWEVDGAEVERELGIPRCLLINDFEAVGHGILTLDSKSLLSINDAPFIPGHPIAVLGPGTGLGEAYLTWDQALMDYAVWPSEGAHGGFAAQGSKQRELQQFVEAELGECEVETVCSGPGIERLYRFISGGEGMPAAKVVESALSSKDQSTEEAVSLFLQILGQEAANLGLKFLAGGGVYIAGGIPPRLGSDKLLDGTLLNAFLGQHTRFHSVRSSFPLYVVNTTESVGLNGAVERAFRIAS